MKKNIKKICFKIFFLYNFLKLLLQVFVTTIQVANYYLGSPTKLMLTISTIRRYYYNSI